MCSSAEAAPATIRFSGDLETTGSSARSEMTTCSAMQAMISCSVAVAPISSTAALVTTSARRSQASALSRTARRARTNRGRHAGYGLLAGGGRHSRCAKEVEMREQNLDIYGHDPIVWSRALKQLEAQAGEEAPGRTCWLATTDSDGRPHLAAVGAIWVDGKFYFVSGPRL